MLEINMDGLNGYADFIMTVGKEVFAAGIFDRSKIKTRALGCRFGVYPIYARNKDYTTRNENGYNVDYMRIPLGTGRDQFYYALVTSKDIGNKYFVTIEESLEEDLYDYLMQNFKLPLLKWWMMPLLNELLNKRLVTREYPGISFGDAPKKLRIKGRDISPRELCIYDMSDLNDASLESVVSDLLRRKIIWISQKNIPAMQFKDFDEYIQRYGGSLVKNLENEIQPLCDLKGTVDTLALKHKRLYPQQAACTNGIIALKKSGVRYGIMNEGMGCGKTIQAMSVVEAYFIEEYLRKNPQKTLKDAYVDGVINYRVIIMAPGHLVEKWAAEIRKEIPFAKVTILHKFSQLCEIRDRGKARNGKEFFVLSKDFCKLGSQVSPIPTMVRQQYPVVSVCKDCYTERGLVFYKKYNGCKGVCPDCGGHNFMKYRLRGYGKMKGLICPECGELLLNSSNISGMISKLEYGSSDDLSITLGPTDFAKKTVTNSRCTYCNSLLWGVNSKPIDMGGEYSSWTQRKPKWRKIGHYKNCHRKSKSSAFVLKGYENDYLCSHGIRQDDYWTMASEYGPRKSAPSAFIKKYLKGYFDFALLDEVHKFEGAGTAQANAAHALIGASDFTLGLTGTISNGSAGSFFWLLYMLDPKRMREKGFEYSAADCMNFCKKYGSVETLYEYNGTEDGVYNASSRGKQLTQPRMKPGISPMLFVDFLLDRCVMLDITDLSKFLPQLEEKIVTCKLPEDIDYSYRCTISQLKEASHSQEGMAALSAMLNFGLSYPDKPYGRHNIMSAYTEDYVLANVENYDGFSNVNSLLPKEAKMVEIINHEISEGRNVFVYASFTGEAESCITGRLQQVIEKYCNLKGRVQILESSSPEPQKREAYIMQKAAEGIKVFITNPRCVETGLDFCFTYEGKKYNYPTLIFMQISHEMAVIWQASRRAYRLNQWEKCRTYYLAYEGTLQTAALEIMAAKQVATSAIQGKFSSEGLAAMAKGVDTRTQLATALAKNDMSDRETLENMFDALNQQNNTSDDGYGEYIPPQTYFELIGTTEDTLASDMIFDEGLSLFEEPQEIGCEEGQITCEIVSTDSESEEFFFGDLFNNDGLLYEVYNAQIIEPPKKPARKKKSQPSGQFSLFELLGIA